MSTKEPQSGQSHVVKEGWLQKKSRHVNRWKRRWIVLSTHSMSIYKQPKDVRLAHREPYLGTNEYQLHSPQRTQPP